MGPWGEVVIGFVPPEYGCFHVIIFLGVRLGFFIVIVM